MSKSTPTSQSRLIAWGIFLAASTAVFFAFLLPGLESERASRLGVLSPPRRLAAPPLPGPPQASGAAIETLVPDSLPGFERRADVPSRLRRVDTQVTADFWAADGSHLHLTVQRNNAPPDAPHSTGVMVSGHRGRRVEDSLFTWIAWRSGNHLFLTWTYPAPGASRVALTRILPAVRAIAQHADIRFANGSDGGP